MTRMAVVDVVVVVDSYVIVLDLVLWMMMMMMMMMMTLVARLRMDMILTNCAVMEIRLRSMKAKLKTEHIVVVAVTGGNVETIPRKHPPSY
jgi:hypothetical protein